MTARIEFTDELSRALATGDLSRWRQVVRGSRAGDPFRALRGERSIETRICDEAGFTDLRAWFQGADEWADGLRVPTATPTTEEEILRAAWEEFEDRIALALSRVRRESATLPCGALPTTGGVLAFVDGFALCVVLGYRFVAEVPALLVIGTLDQPRSAFDLLDRLDEYPHEIRNELKRMLQSSHRLIWHRDVVAHVDRRLEPQVCGPSIDTLQLAEILARRFYVSPGLQPPRRVLEVGTGSGFVLAGLARHLDPDTELIGIEADFAAVSCTNRNLASNMPAERAVEREPALIRAPFRPGLLEGRFDLVVCNPPYIPPRPGERSNASRGRSAAVSGLRLIDELLESAPDLLSEAGEILMMVSSVTPLDYVEDRIPSGFQLVPDPLPRWEVLFELEEIFTSPGYLKFLESTPGRVRHRGGSFVHDLHPVWIRRSASA